MNTEHTCAGCIWEDDCRAANLWGTRCSYFDGAVPSFAYDLYAYKRDLEYRNAQYLLLVEEQQS